MIKVKSKTTKGRTFYPAFTLCELSKFTIVINIDKSFFRLVDAVLTVEVQFLTVVNDVNCIPELLLFLSEMDVVFSHSPFDNRPQVLNRLISDIGMNV